MGLDMYLSARTYVEKVDWAKLQENSELSYNDKEVINPEFAKVVKTAGLADLANDIYGAQVSVTALYWRKANAIHNWFVNSVQQGEDNCGEYYVSHDKLDELLATCERVYETRDPSELKPIAGFFFGSTDVDEWYWKDIKRTISSIKKIKKHKLYNKLSFYYQSSW